MSCTDIVCGIGDWTGPKPGDPSNNSVLSAVAEVGGIRVSWSYPTVHPAAVSYFTVYRGVTPVFGSANVIAEVGGNSYLDPHTSNDQIEYYFWIVMTSIYGTVNTPIGPVSATTLKSIEEIIKTLSQQINESTLAAELRSKIGYIATLGHTLEEEIKARLADGSALVSLIQGVDGRVHSVGTYLNAEIIQRKSAIEAYVAQLSVMGARLDNTYSYIASEVQAYAGPTSALASQINSLGVTVNGNVATGQVGLTARINTLKGTMEALWTAQVSVNGYIGGFGILNDGSRVTAGFDVDQFWIGKDVKDNPNAIKPFIVTAGKVYIDTALISDLTVDKLKSSDNKFVFKNGKLKVDYLDVTDLTVTGNMIVTGTIQTGNLGSNAITHTDGSTGADGETDAWIELPSTANIMVSAYFTQAITGSKRWDLKLDYYDPITRAYVSTSKSEFHTPIVGTVGAMMVSLNNAPAGVYRAHIYGGTANERCGVILTANKR